MRIMNLVCQLIWKRKGSYALLIGQMVIMLVIFLSLVGKIQYIEESEKVAKIFNDENAFYFNPSMFYEESAIDLDKIIGNISEKKEFGKVASLNFETENGEEFFSYGYNDVIIQQTNVELKSGEWFEQEKQYEGIPIISIGNQYKTGDIIYLKGHPNGTVEKCQVIGTIKDKSYVTTFISGGSKDFASLSDLVSEAEGSFIVPIDSTYFATFHSDEIICFYNYGTMIICDNDLHQEIYNALSPYGAISNITVMTQNFQTDTRNFLIINSIVLLVFTLLGIAGIGGINSMLSILNERRYIIYYMCGMTRKTCSLVEALRSGFIIGFTYILVMLLYYFTNMAGLFSTGEYRINWITWVITLVYVIGIYTITSLYFAIKLAKQNLISLYKQKA